MNEVIEIVVITYLFGELFKASKKIPNTIIPVLCGILGGWLGYVCLDVMESFPADNPITAISIGIFSGLAATGVHQIGKQTIGFINERSKDE